MRRNTSPAGRRHRASPPATHRDMCFDDACHTEVNRRQCLGTASGAFAVLGLVPGMLRRLRGFRPFMAQALADPAVLHGPATFTATDGAPIRAHLARPDRAGFFPPVLVNHGNTGIPEDIRAAAAYVARWGYVALVIDSDSREGDGSGTLNRPIASYRTEAFARRWLADNDAAR